MADTDRPKNSPSTQFSLRKIPQAMTTGVVVLVLAVVINFTTSSTVIANGVMTKCRYFNVAAIVAAAMLVALAFVSYKQWRDQYDRERMPSSFLWLGIGVLLIGAVIHALRAFGIVGGMC